MGVISKRVQGALVVAGVAAATLTLTGAAPAGAAYGDCSVPSAAVTNVTAASATLSWDPANWGPYAPQYTVRGLPGGDVVTSRTEADLNGLPSSHNVTVSVTPTCYTGGLFPFYAEGPARSVSFSTAGNIGGVRETSTTVQGPGDGFYRLVNRAGEAFSKSSSCAEGDGGPVVNAARDTSKFSQQWKFLKQANGNYVIASLCQPTVLLTAHIAPAGQSAYSFEYGAAGRQGELGAWNPGYEYNVAHTAAQEWEVRVNEDGSVSLTNWGAGQRIDGWRLEAV